MKITGPQSGTVPPVELGKVKKAAGVAGADAAQGDQIVLSTDVSAIAAAHKAIADTPDVRMDKVEAIRQQLAEGTYRINADTIADKMLTEAQLTRINRK